MAETEIGITTLSNDQPAGRRRPTWTLATAKAEEGGRETMNERLLHPPPSQLVVDVLHRKAGDDKKGLILFWVQTESMGEVAAVVIARIEREPEGLGSGQES